MFLQIQINHPIRSHNQMMNFRIEKSQFQMSNRQLLSNCFNRPKRHLRKKIAFSLCFACSANISAINVKTVVRERKKFKYWEQIRNLIIQKSLGCGQGRKSMEIVTVVALDVKWNALDVYKALVFGHSWC